MSKIIAYASSTRPNHLWSAAQFNSAAEKNRIDCDIPLVAASDLAAKDAQIGELRSKLFPYADSTEISGISWDGKYLIGDKASISFFHEMKNRGEQIDVYKRAYDQNIAAKDAEIAKLREALESIRLYANDTLSGRADGGPDDRAWQREAVIECRNRARAALEGGEA
jgi:hypothetical protein